MESEFIEWIRARVPPDRRVYIGPGDDAAVLAIAGEPNTVATTDLLTEGVDFRLAEVAAERIGRKALAVNLSDLAAMAARPLAALVSVALPRSDASTLVRQLARGILALADQYDIALAGGDTNTWDGQLVISVTAIGTTTSRGPLRRSAAKPGDRILATGAFGGSILGKQFDFHPRVSEALLLHDQYDLHAGIDVSDGLSLDVARMARASQCGAVLKLDDVPIARAAQQLAEEDPAGRSALDHALSDGEDFELLLAVPPAEANRMLTDQPLDVPLTDIGHMVSEQGLWCQDASGKNQPLTPRGYEHGGATDGRE